ncbi:MULTISPECIES: chaplin [unclassified Streptomyces]|uniref:chaplin n=1 Tax=unclassified Streptomyces TaxID=2593676 RepID=UPI001BE87096|nr:MULTISPECIES: chaplin [unclassified Streptomyces]MBT2408835.1 chaplin [Streptomyces sp. ISL-21]MBT2454894.1 chaplin [Streptomyces sp. ISL-86]MBT2613319.1 chaplin [Streptomyces sp. ISL-87]
MSRIAKAVAITASAAAVLVGSAGMAAADATAEGAAIGSPGVLSGNVLQVPIHIPINICGNTVNIIGLLNPAVGNTCINDGGGDKAYHHKADHHDEY